MISGVPSRFPPSRVSLHAAPSVLYIHMAALGDAIMSSGALRRLKQSLPEWKVSVLARTQSCEYFQRLSYVDNVIPFVDERWVQRRSPWKLFGAPAELLRVLRRLRTSNFQAALQWRGQFPDTVLSRWTRAPRRIATVQSIHRRSPLPVERLRFLVTDLVKVERSDAHLVEAMAAPVDRLISLVGNFSSWAESLELDFPLSAEDKDQAEAFMASEQLEPRAFAIVAFSAKSAFNSWPPERFAAVADALQIQHSLRVVLSGLPEQRALEDQIASQMTTVPIRSTGRIPFYPLCALLDQARLLVSLNTGISHVAAALKTPVVVLNGRDGAAITPWACPHRIVTKNIYYPARHPHSAEWGQLVSRIAVHDVTSAIDDILSAHVQAS